MPLRFNLQQLCPLPEDGSSETTAAISAAIAAEALEAFLSNLSLVRDKIDFGHNNIEMNRSLLRHLPNIFFAYIRKADDEEREELEKRLEDTEHVGNDIKNFWKQYERKKYNNWIYDFLIAAIERIGSCNSLLVTRVVIRAVQIFNTLQKLHIELKIV